MLDRIAFWRLARAQRRFGAREVSPDLGGTCVVGIRVVRYKAAVLVKWMSSTRCNSRYELAVGFWAHASQFLLTGAHMPHAMRVSR